LIAPSWTGENNFWVCVLAGAQNGCLYGNVTAELNEHSEKVRRRLAEIFLGNSKSRGRVPEGSGKGGRVATEIQTR
jgi:hypothetical protein